MFNLHMNHDLRRKISNFFIGAGLIIYFFPTLLAFCFVILGLILASTHATLTLIKFFNRSFRR